MPAREKDLHEIRAGNVSANPSQTEWGVINQMRREREAQNRTPAPTPAVWTGSERSPSHGGSASATTYSSGSSTPDTIGATASFFATAGAVLAGVWGLLFTPWPLEQTLVVTATAAGAGALFGAALWVALSVLGLAVRWTVRVVVFVSAAVVGLHILGAVDGPVVFQRAVELVRSLM